MDNKKVIAQMMSLRDEAQAAHLMRFFKTGKGQYGFGDQFLGIKVPVTRSVVVQFRDLPLKEIDVLLNNPWHEIRLCGFLILVKQFDSLSRHVQDFQYMKLRDDLVDFYLQHVDRANNWDLVDLSAPYILGHWLLLPSRYQEKEKLEVLETLARSGHLWRERISMVSTLWPTRHGETSYALHFAMSFLGHSHDLMHKAVGWMLREVGKSDINQLRQFLHDHVHEMPRTSLRYAIERMTPEERAYWMASPPKKH